MVILTIPQFSQLFTACHRLLHRSRLDKFGRSIFFCRRIVKRRRQRFAVKERSWLDLPVRLVFESVYSILRCPWRQQALAVLNCHWSGSNDSQFEYPYGSECHQTQKLKTCRLNRKAQSHDPHWWLTEYTHSAWLGRGNANLICSKSSHLTECNRSLQ